MRPGPPPSGTATASTRHRATGRAIVAAAVLDAVSILAFAAAGRSTHERDGGTLGLLETAWPFLVAAAVGWVVSRGWRRPAHPWPTGVAVWLITWAGGLALRAATGGGTARPFVVVAVAVLGVLLVGWRAAATVVSSRGRRRADGRPAPGR